MSLHIKAAITTHGDGLACLLEKRRATSCSRSVPREDTGSTLDRNGRHSLSSEFTISSQALFTEELQCTEREKKTVSEVVVVLHLMNIPRVPFDETHNTR